MVTMCAEATSKRPPLDSTVVSRLRFRFATHQDIPAVVDLVQSAYRGEESRAGWTTEADLIDGQRIDATMLARTIDQAETYILLAEAHDEPSGHELVGCAEISRYSGDGGGAYFGLFAVRPSLQGQGIGGQILDEIERVSVELLREARLVLVVISLRSDMVELYARRGFVPTGDVHLFPYGDERFGRPKRDDLELLVMAKELTRARPFENPDRESTIR
jgi:GNAT superfamily N-acetyltransferase